MNLKKKSARETCLTLNHKRFKGKVEQSWEWISPNLGVVAIEKGAFGSPSTMVANYYILLWESNIINIVYKYISI